MMITYKSILLANLEVVKLKQPSLFLITLTPMVNYYNDNDKPIASLLQLLTA
jgi:hypothetical protein